MSEREPMMCVACGTVLVCDCTRMGTGTQDHRTVAAAHYEAGMREAARIAAGLGEQWVTKWRKGLKCDSRLEAFSDAADEIEAAILADIVRAGTVDTSETS